MIKRKSFKFYISILLSVLITLNSASTFGLTINGKVFGPTGTDDENQIQTSTSVELWKIEDDRRHYMNHVNVDANGQYQFELNDLEPEKNYFLKALQNEQLNAYTNSFDQPITFDENTTEIVQDLNLTNPQVVGTIYQSDGVVLSDRAAYIEIYKIEDNGYRNNYGYVNIGQEDSNQSQYKVGGLPTGNYTFRVKYYGNMDYADNFYSNIQVDANQTDQLITKDLVLTTPVVKGTVYQPDNTVYNSSNEVHCFIEVKSSDNMRFYNFDIRSEGQYMVGGILDGEYQIRAVANNNNAGLYNSKWQTVNIENGSLTSLDIHLLGEESGITGSVKKANGELASSGSVNFFDLDDRHIDGASIKSDGSFLVTGLNDGTYKIRAYPDSDNNDDYSSESDYLIITVTDGVYTGDPIVLQFNAPQLIIETVDPNGNPANSGRICISNDMSSSTMGGGSDNIRLINQYEPGTYTVFGIAPKDSGYARSESQEFVIDSEGKANPEWIQVVLTSGGLAGTVSVENGETATKGEVNVYSINENLSYRILINSDGSFYLGDLEDGEYELQAFPEFGDTTYTPSENIRILVNEGNYDGEPIELVLTKPQIKGNVLNPDGSSTVFGNVVVNKTTGEYVLGGSIDENGNFVIGGLEAGTYLIKARPYNSPDHNFTDSLEVEITISEDSDLQNIVLHLTRPQMSGVVIGPNNEQISSGWVEVRDSNGQHLFGDSINTMGQFNIGGLEDGSYTIKAYPYSAMKYTPSLEVNFIIENGSYSGGDLVLQLTAPQILGHMVGPNGLIERYGYIEIKTVSGRHVDGVSVNHLGEFGVANLPDGKYMLKAIPNNNSQYSDSETYEVEIIDGIYNGENLVIVLTEPKLTGVVCNPDDSLAPNSWVEVRSASGHWGSGFGVDFKSVFKIGALPQGEYFIKAYPGEFSNYAESKEMKITVDENGNIAETDIKIYLEGPQIVGEVKRPDNTMEAYGWVEIKNNAGEWIKGVSVSRQGQFKIAGLENGRYYVKAMPNSDSEFTSSEDVEIVISNGAYSGSGLTITLNSPQVTGRVKGPSNELTSYGWINVRKADGMWIEGVGTDRNGNFRIGNLEDGDYYLKAYPDMHSEFSPSSEVSITISDGQFSQESLTINLSAVQVKGTVQDPGGVISNASWIEVQKKNNNDDWDWIDGVGVNWDGEFLLGGLSDGIYRIRAYPQMNGLYTASDYLEINISGGSYSGSSIKLVLSIPQIIGVVSGPNNEIIRNGWVQILDTNGDHLEGISIDWEGRFSVAGLESGEYQLKAYPTMESNFTPSDSYTINVAESGVLTPTLILKGNQGTGTVTGPENQIIKRAWVEVYDLDGGWILSTGVDQRGNFKLSGLDNGTYEIQAFVDASSQFANSSRVEFEVLNGVVSDIITISLSKQGVTGVVKIPDEGSLNGVWVEVGDADSKWLFSVQVDKNGSFKLPELTPGHYKIQAFIAENTSYTESDVLDLNIPESGNLDSVELTLKAK